MFEGNTIFDAIRCNSIFNFSYSVSDTDFYLTAMNEEPKEKVHESGLPKPQPSQLPHHYVHEWTIEPEDKGDEVKQLEDTST